MTIVASKPPARLHIPHVEAFWPWTGTNTQPGANSPVDGLWVRGGIQSTGDTMVANAVGAGGIQQLAIDPLTATLHAHMTGIANAACTPFSIYGHPLTRAQAIAGGPVTPLEAYRVYYYRFLIRASQSADGTGFWLNNSAGGATQFPNLGNTGVGFAHVGGSWALRAWIGPNWPTNITFTAVASQPTVVTEWNKLELEVVVASPVRDGTISAWLNDVQIGVTEPFETGRISPIMNAGTNDTKLLPEFMVNGGQTLDYTGLHFRMSNRTREGQILT